jgi:hypothetical protein
MRKTLMKIAGAVVAVVAATGLAAAPANAAAGSVDMPYGMAYGASTTTGTVHFTIGYSATVTGAVHAVTAPKYICVEGSNGTIHTGYACMPNEAIPGGPNVGYTFDLAIYASGGVQRVDIQMWEIAPTEVRLVAKEHCSRTGCTRDPVT